MQYKEIIHQPLAGHHIGMALTLVTLWCFGTCAKEDQITIDVGTKLWNCDSLGTFGKKRKSVIWLTITHFVYVHVYEVHTDEGGYMGKGSISFYRQIPIDIQIRIYMFKVIITKICI